MAANPRIVGRIGARPSPMMIGKTRQAASPACGVLWPMPLERFHHARLLPCEALAEWVEHYWFVSWDLRGLPPQEQHTLPHPSVHWVIEPAQASIAGVHTGRFTRLLDDASWVFGIKFKPGGFQPFLGRPVSDLQDRTIDAAEVFGAAGKALEAEVRGCADEHAMADAAERFLLAHRPAPDPLARRASELVARIAQDRELTRAEQLADREALPLRQLQRLFREHVGVGPKWVIQRYRLHEAVERLKTGEQVDWADFAQTLGYFDQAHFIAAFRKLVRCTPATYRRLLSGAEEAGSV